MAKFIKFWQWVNMTNTRTRKRKSGFYRIHQRLRSFFIAAIFFTCISWHSWKRLLLWSSPYCLCYVISYYWYVVQNVIFEDENQYHKCVFQNTFATNIGRNPCHIHAQCIWRVFPALYISLHLVMLHSIILNWIKFSPLMRRWKKLFESLLNVLKVKKPKTRTTEHVHKYSHPLLNTLLMHFWQQLQPHVFVSMMLPSWHSYFLGNFFHSSFQSLSGSVNLKGELLLIVAVLLEDEALPHSEV